MKLVREDLKDVEAPADLIETKNIFLGLLVKERDIWVHMALFTRTGQEVHRVLADELVLDILEEIPVAIADLENILRNVGVDPDEFGFDESSGPHHQDSGEAKIGESAAGVSRKPSSDGKARGSSSKHLCGLTAWNT